jgi:hypothetical protein
MSTVRIAMWSGPRNISTAMLRSFGNRRDTHVCDEPLYAHYLRVTGKAHPGAEEVIAHHEADWRRVVADLTGPLPASKTIYYQKHMAHHLLPQIGREWLSQVNNCFLIREPKSMLTSLHKQMPEAKLEDTGLPQQLDIFQRTFEQTGDLPPVLDAKDVLQNPGPLLAHLCGEVGVSFADEMLAWPAGRRDTDGVWAKHWYAAVEASTGFQPYREKSEPLPDEMKSLLEDCIPYYEELHRHRLKA